MASNSSAIVTGRGKGEASRPRADHGGEVGLGGRREVLVAQIMNDDVRYFIKSLTIPHFRSFSFVELKC